MVEGAGAASGTRPVCLSPRSAASRSQPLAGEPKAVPLMGTILLIVVVVLVVLFLLGYFGRGRIRG
jgi:hypothetical protein